MPASKSSVPPGSTRASREATVVALAYTVFGNREKSTRWLQLANDQLGGSTPMSVLSSQTGEQKVISLLWGIDEGIYS